jgi:hypothetical protein
LEFSARKVGPNVYTLLSAQQKFSTYTEQQSNTSQTAAGKRNAHTKPRFDPITSGHAIARLKSNWLNSGPKVCVISNQTCSWPDTVRNAWRAKKSWL